MSMQGSCHLSFVEKWWAFSYTKGRLLLLINWAHFCGLADGYLFCDHKMYMEIDKKLILVVDRH